MTIGGAARVSPDGRDEPARSGPLRTCVGCRAVRHPDDLVRVVLGPAGELLVGRSLPGRGAWVCRDGERCLAIARRRRAFDRALRATVAPAAFAEMAAKFGPGAVPDGRTFDHTSLDVRR